VQTGAANPSAAQAAAATIAGARSAIRQELERAVQGRLASVLQLAQQRLTLAEQEFARLDRSMSTRGFRAPATVVRDTTAARTRLDGARRDLQRGQQNRDASAALNAQQTSDGVAAEVRRILQAVQSMTTGVPPELLAAANDFFAGRYEQAQVKLGVMSGDGLPAPLQLQLSLFRAATYFSLLVHNGESDTLLRDSAMDAVKDCRRLSPSYVPDGAAFSPRFVKFYREVP
ncbi:MAG: hypothetical protein ABL961_17545, partial [Vicinamibacterales bacterium]